MSLAELRPRAGPAELRRSGTGREVRIASAEPAEVGAQLTVAIVSYNTRALTLAAVRTLLDTTRDTTIRVVVWDNDSSDGSADAVAVAFPQVEVVRSPTNIGFAAANNRIAEMATSEYLLLLNPDTEVHPGAVDALMAFARAQPQAGIWGGRTVFADGSLNIASCWRRITLWSAFCMATGLTAAFPRSELFNREAMPSWPRDSVREVDIVVGCFFLIRLELWRELGGFDLRYWMYGEEADLCARARGLGWRPAITPAAQIMHLVGAASRTQARKRILSAQARSTLIRDHWPAWQVPLGISLMWLWGALRVTAARAGRTLRPGPVSQARLETWETVWRQRRSWLEGYGPKPPAPAHKERLTKGQRFLRLLASNLDPRAWLHLVRMVNYWNYSHVIPRRKLTLGPGAAISPTAVFSNAERIVAGRGLHVGDRCHLWAGPRCGRIVIGDDVLFGPEVMVTAAGYRFNDGQPVTEQAMDEADVVIGDDVWLATRVVVLPGARIGNGAIIGAGAVVRGQIPPMSIAVGSPARVVGQRHLPDLDRPVAMAGDDPRM